MKITYVEVRNKNLPEDENIEGWGVVVNGHLVAADSYRDSLTCMEIAENLVQALGASLEERVVEVFDRWDWVQDVLPNLKNNQSMSDKNISTEKARLREALVTILEFYYHVLPNYRRRVLDAMDIEDEVFEQHVAILEEEIENQGIVKVTLTNTIIKHIYHMLIISL